MGAGTEIKAEEGFELEPVPEEGFEMEGAGVEPELGMGTAQLEEDVRDILPEVFEQPILTPEQIRRQLEGPGKMVLRVQDETGMETGDLLDAYVGPQQTLDEFLREITRRKYTNLISELAWSGKGGLLELGGMEFGTVSAGIKLTAKVLRDGPWQARAQNSEGFQSLVSALRRKSEWWDEMAQWAYNEAQSGEYMAAEGGGPKAFIANAVARTLPLMALSTASAVITGGTSLGPAAGAFLAGAFAEREQIYRGALADGATEEQAQLEGMVGGTINGVIEIAQVSKILRLGKRAGDPVMKEFAAAVRERAMKKIAKAGAKATKQHIADSIQEGFEEVAQQWVGEGLAIIVHGKEMPTMQDALTISGQSFAGGAGAGFFLGLGTLVVEGSTQSRAEGRQPPKTMTEQVPKPDMVMTPEQLTQYEETLTKAEAADAKAEEPGAEGPAPVATGETEAAPGAVEAGERAVPEVGPAEAEAVVAPEAAGVAEGGGLSGGISGGIIQGEQTQLPVNTEDISIPTSGLSGGFGSESEQAQRPPEEIPERKVSRAAQRVQEEAIAKDLAESLGELPTYETMSMQDQARMAAQEIARDYENAKQMAYGNVPTPPRLREASIYRAVAVKARMEGDVETLRNLAVVHPQISIELTAMGQAIKAADVGTLADPVKAMQDVQKAKEQAVGKRRKVKDIRKTKTEWAKEAKAEIRKAVTHRQSWTEFVDSIRC